jgi:hypothetical protein
MGRAFGPRDGCVERDGELFLRGGALEIQREEFFEELVVG